jgi:hypothetical protein
MSARGFLTLAALGVSLIIAGPAAADPPDVNQFVRQDQVEAQKAEREVTGALAEARRLEASNPETAIKRLRSARGRVEDARGLSDERRRDLLAQLDQRLRHVQDSLRRQQAAAQEAADNAAARERDRQARQHLTPRQSPTDQAKDFINRRREQLGSSADISRRKQQGIQSVMADIDLSSVPVDRDMRFPKDWRRRTDLRKKFTGPQLTQQEKNLIKALNSTLSVDFNKVALRDVLNFLQQKTNTSIIVDKEALREAQVDYDDPVEFTAPKVSYRTILRKLLADRGLAYILNQGVIEVVTPQRARETLVTRTYSIQDLMPLTPGLSPILQRAQMIQAAKLVADQIMSGTDPSIWKENGGTATITFNPATMSLVVRAPAEMHYTMNNLFTK